MAQGTWIGQTLSGRYRIEERLGQGGMSAVYKATDPNLRRVVAIKMIHAHLSENPDFVRRFEEEAAAVAQLRHPNIIQVYDFNHDSGTYYMVMEFIPGETLQDRLRRLNEKNRRLKPETGAHIISQVGEAIQYAHDRGMIHRDIKPANIMLDIYGKAILMDFGIAKMMGGQLHTATGVVVGTAMYMSPEQIIGERVDERSDIYSLGVTLFETLSGKPPFEADSAMTLMMMHINDPVPNIRELRPEVPEELVQVVEKALQKKKELRYQSANQIVGALNAMGARLKEMQAARASYAQTMVSEQPPANATQVESAVRQPGSRDEILPEPYQPPDNSTATPPLSSLSTAADSRPVIVPPTNNQPAHEMAVPFMGSPIPQTAPKQAVRKNYLPLLIGGGAGLFVLVAAVLVGVFLLARNYFAGGTSTETPTSAANLSNSATATAEAMAVAVVVQPAATFTTTVVPTATLAPTATLPPPTPTPEPVYTSTPAVPADKTYYVLIKNITRENNRYVVDYETFGYTEALPGMHVHFFFDTVKPENAGMPGSGPWILYGGPRPFTKYAVADRPANAMQMCALVANSNHSVQPDSGNCFDLP